MINKCIGCGAILQGIDEKKEGYVKDITEDKVCKRCFRLKNYGEYITVNKSNLEYKTIFDKIKKEKELILYLCDILTIDESLKELNNFNGEVILVITKKDLLPKSVKENKLVYYIKKNYNLNVKNIIFVSSNKNYNLDELYNLIIKNKRSNKVYVVGNTNAGKSTLINAFIKSYGNNDASITTSMVPATTLDLITIKLNEDVTLIDTPGIVMDYSYVSNTDINTIKKISSKTEIKPRTYQIKPNESLLIENLARIDYISDSKNSFTLYLSNNLKVNRIKLNTNNNLRDLNKTSFDLKNNKDIVISGLCFCKIVSNAKVNVYTKENVKVYERDNLI